jgi:hypothetical protein
MYGCSVSGRSEVMREVKILLEAGKCGREIVQIKNNDIFFTIANCDTKPRKCTNLFLTLFLFLFLSLHRAF